MYYKIVLCCVLSVLQLCDSANILVVIPTPSYSHHVSFQPIWKELSLRGHKITVITANPMNDKKLTNLTEIDISNIYECVERYKIWELMTEKNLLRILDTLLKFLYEGTDIIFNNTQVQGLLKDPNAKFDLIFYEASAHMCLALAYKFKCPAIGIQSMDPLPIVHAIMGNPTHPLVTPDYSLKIEDVENMTFMDRLSSVFCDFFSEIFLKFIVFPFMDDINRKYFGDDIPDMNSLIDLTDMIFIITDPIFHNMRAVNPNTLNIGGGLHIKPPKPLPKDLKQYLDEAEEGVIYFSLGSNVKGNFLDEQSKKAIISVFSQLPYKVLMKIELENYNIPQNIKIGKWLPQQDILRHPNIKLFVTHGGLQSVQEAVTNGVPMVGIPFFGDQYNNIFKGVKKGFVVKVDKENITEESFKEALLEVLNNPKYKETTLKMKEIMYDEPMTSLEKVVWWTEYVLRHKGAKHFKSHITQIPFYQYYFLDVFGVVILGLSILIYGFYKIFCLLRYLCTRIFSKNKTKND
ncbi:UDP-glucosyltransferase 2 isoform X1 [Aethina tumida]|uniref:UDP-glucosyltransferase 2 isoform X1 n=1 Tax=Aethina tumida TaxID=116153 RepID=UPI0021477B5E|nr:UDP-glucosyltransferase 2 isoform X1 [Aethina tumida]